MLKQAKNKVFIEGILAENGLEYGSYEKNGTVVENINGSIKILVEEEGKEPMEIPVRAFAGKYTREGKPNPAYKSLEDVMTNFVSIASAGNKDAADRVRISGANIAMNEYYNQAGNLVSFPRIAASFINKVTGAFRPRTSFECEVVVSSISRVVDSEGVEVEPAKLKVMTCLPQYGGKVDVVPFYATDPMVIDGIESYWEANKAYAAWGELNFTSETHMEEKTPSGFGKAIEKPRTSTISELILTGGGDTAIEEEFGFDLSEVNRGLADRKARLEEDKAKSSERYKAKAAPAPANKVSTLDDLGF